MCVCVCVRVLQEEEVVNVLRSALEQCLVLGSGDHHQWNAQLLDELIDRYVRMHPTEVHIQLVYMCQRNSMC